MTRATRLAALLLSAVANVAAAPAATADAVVELEVSVASACALRTAAAVEDVAVSCTSCHGNRSGSGHPVDIDYEGAQTRRWGRRRTPLRPVAEVVRRGVFLPDGKVQCLTCHDPRSEHRYGLAVPPETDPAALMEREAWGGRRPGVEPAPLCLACHAIY
jgi:hypothetical protein